MVNQMAAKTGKRFYIQCLAIAAVMFTVFEIAKANVRIGFDAQAVKCLPEYSTYFVKLWSKGVERGSIYSFDSKGLEPVFSDGTGLIKIARGLPGDKLVINDDGVYINGELVVEGLPLAHRLGHESTEYFREETIPDGSYLFLGTAAESYDGRYWGYVSESQIRGEGIPIY